jgi:hypothetical protein
MSGTLFPFPRRVSGPSVAQLHSRLIDLLAQVRIPFDLPSSNRASDKAAGLRGDAQYLHDIYKLLEPIVERVAQKAADEADCKDVTELARVPLEALDDYVLSVMRGRAYDIEDELQEELWSFRQRG